MWQGWPDKAAAHQVVREANCSPQSKKIPRKRGSRTQVNRKHNLLINWGGYVSKLQPNKHWLTELKNNRAKQDAQGDQNLKPKENFSKAAQNNGAEKEPREHMISLSSLPSPVFSSWTSHNLSHLKSGCLSQVIILSQEHKVEWLSDPGQAEGTHDIEASGKIHRHSAKLVKTEERPDRYRTDRWPNRGGGSYTKERGKTPLKLPLSPRLHSIMRAIASG